MSLLSSVALFAGYGLCVAFMPLVRRVAVQYGLLDHPDGSRRRHPHPIPRLGGIAVFLSVLVVIAGGAALDDPAHLLVLLPFVVSIAIGATILFVMGLVDDLRGVPPLAKLVAQSVAAVAVHQAGFRLDVLVLTPAHTVSLGALSLPVTVLWVVGLSNAFNLVDGADGLAAGVAVVALLGTAVSAAIVRDPVVLWCALALLGAVLGFLRFNFPPARIFLGDSGSLVVGFLLAVLTVKGATRPDGSVYALAPILLLSYPLLDTGVAMMRRWLRGEPLSRADGRHIHHQLRALDIGPRQSLVLICGLSAIVATLGLSATFAPPEFTMAIAVAGAAMLLLIFAYGLRWLQYHEFLEAGASVTSAARRGRSVIRDRIRARDVATLLRDAESFDELGTVLERSAASFRFVHMELQGRSTLRQFVEPIPVLVSSTRTWKLEYPIDPPDSAPGHFAMLSIWCPVEGEGVRAGAERVAKILAPAIAGWLASHWEGEEMQRIVAEKFPGVKAPTHGFPVITGDFALIARRAV